MCLDTDGGVCTGDTLTDVRVSVKVEVCVQELIH